MFISETYSPPCLISNFTVKIAIEWSKSPFSDTPKHRIVGCLYMYVCTCIHIYIYIYIYVCVCVCVCQFIYLRIYFYVYFICILYPHDIPLSDYTPMTWQVSPFFETNCADRATGAWPVGACFRRLREGGGRKQGNPDQQGDAFGNLTQWKPWPYEKL